MIQSLLRSMELLEVLKEKNRSFTIAELADTMNLPPSTVHRILQTFCEKKYVIRDERSHTYRLGPALIPLGKAASKGIRLQDAAKPILASLSQKTGEDVYLMIPVGNKGLVIEKFDGPSHLKVVEAFGYEMHLHCG
ncbi:MAG: helix-turn-helix domain-containing protein, partial [Lachnospiraceae bacterium]|nr:helix-turn-helix domain-containing protein [Lachnospiraceae bacterium]